MPLPIEIEEMDGQLCGVAFFPAEDTCVYDIEDGAQVQGIAAHPFVSPEGDRFVCVTIADPVHGAMTAMLDDDQLQIFAHRLSVIVRGFNAADDPFQTLRSGTLQ